MNDCKTCGPDGATRRCKSCLRAKGIRYRAQNKAKIKAYNALWRALNKEKHRANAAIYRKKNAPTLQAQSLKWQRENKGRIREKCAEYNAANRAEIAAQRSAYRELNKAAIKAAKAKWHADNRKTLSAKAAARYEANMDRIKARVATYQKNNPTVGRINGQNYNARKRVVGGQLSKGLPERLYVLQRGKCAACKKILGKKYHLDHIVPLALEGPNVDSNIQLLCPPCNHKKHAKHPIDFMQSRGFLL